MEKNQSEEGLAPRMATAQCEKRFNQLNDGMKALIVEGIETYTPRCVVLLSSCAYYVVENLQHLASLDGFMAVKIVNRSVGRSEIIFEKE